MCLAYVQTFDCQLGGKRVSQEFTFVLSSVAHVVD